MSSLTAPFPIDHQWRASIATVRAAWAATVWGGSQAVVLRFVPNVSPRLPREFHRAICRAAGITIDVIGQEARPEGVMLVANHISWVDIPVIGSVVLGTFVAKAEVGGMGMFGRLSDLQKTIYVQRERRSAAQEQRNEIADRMAAGHNIILFPEGTSGAGTRVLPFKSSLFGVTEHVTQDILIQPVTIAYTHINGLPINRTGRYKIAWVGDMEMGPHVWELLGLGKIRASVEFHPAVRRADFANRKQLAKHCEEMVAEGLRRANARPIADDITTAGRG